MKAKGTAPSNTPAATQRARQDFADTTLAKLANPFARLAYLASLRDFARDEYGHWGMENLYGAEAANTALIQLHREVFREVSALPLGELVEQIREYLALQEDGGLTLLRNWRTGLLGAWLLPPQPGFLEAENFRINVNVVLEVIDRGERDLNHEARR